MFIPTLLASFIFLISSHCLTLSGLFHPQEGHVYIADYAILEDIPTIHRDSDIRFLAGPVVLFYVREFGDLIPLAIQLGQTPGPDNPIWTPRDTPEDWILAKLWVRCADFHYHFAITHLLKTHFVVEPFAISTMRQLSSSHPVYKLLKPHFRLGELIDSCEYPSFESIIIVVVFVTSSMSIIITMISIIT